MSVSAATRSRWHPGYSVAVVSTVALVLTAPGQTLLVSLLNVPLREAFRIDAFTLNAMYTVATVTAALPLVWVGKLTDRFGPRRMMIAVSIAFGAACVLMAGAVHVAMVFVGFFLLRFLGQGALSLVSGHALAMWFHQRLGRLEGLRMVALFAAWALLPAMTQALVEGIGWRTTWATFGVVIAIVVPVLAARFVHDRPEDIGLTLDGAPAPSASEAHGPGLTLRDAMRTRAYWLLMLASVMPPMIGTAILFDIQPLLGARGMDAGTAALAVSAWIATQAALALPAGHLVDRFRPGPILCAGVLAVGASSALLIDVASIPKAMTAMIMMGVGQSLIAPTATATTARFFGRDHHGAIRSAITRAGILATGLGPLVFGASQRWAAGYDPALLAFALLCLPVALASLWLTRSMITGSRAASHRGRTS